MLLRRGWAAVAGLFTGVPADAPSTFGDPVPPRRASPVPTGGTAEVAHRPPQLIAASLATVLGFAIILSMRWGEQPRAVDARSAAAPAVLTPVPGQTMTWLPAARGAAATCPGLPSAVLVAIVQVESSTGLDPRTSPAGAVGPMQFLPSTWAAYATDGDGDGIADVMNPVDALYGAARLLCANGAGDPQRLASALWRYNQSDEYVRQVLALARFMPGER